ncbi:MAG: PIN domain-containing protein [Leptospira sp.]|nr:PIN domain-containing protein [Leptospira sp.]
MKDKIFLDTNIILYQFSEDKKKKKIAIDIVAEAVKTSNYVISYQVIQEFSNVALNKNKEYFSINELKSYLNDILFPLCKYYPSPDFYLKSLVLKNKFKYSY